MAEKKDAPTKVGRDAKTGRFISLTKAGRRKKTTAVETSKEKQ
jgi:hypothetical protein